MKIPQLRQYFDYVNLRFFNFELPRIRIEKQPRQKTGCFGYFTVREFDWGLSPKIVIQHRHDHWFEKRTLIHEMVHYWLWHKTGGTPVRQNETLLWEKVGHNKRFSRKLNHILRIEFPMYRWKYNHKD